MNNIAKKIGKGAAVVSSAYILGTAVLFNNEFGRLNEIETEKGVAEVSRVVQGLKKNYSNRSLPSKILRFGEYITYKFYPQDQKVKEAQK